MSSYYSICIGCFKNAIMNTDKIPIYTVCSFNKCQQDLQTLNDTMIDAIELETLSR